MLAPLEFWRKRFPTSRGGIDVDGAADYLINSGYSVGVYNPLRIRGRGAWWDRGRAVLNLGDRLIVDGKSIALTDIDGSFLYEAAAPLRYTSAAPLSDEEAQAFLEVCEMPRWERPVSGVLLAGWSVIAPICGAMPWRPHIWLTAKAGLGKSWVLDNIVRRAVGELAVVVQSRTTEAGLRQQIEGDARPVLFDEAEGEDQRSRARMQAVIELARAGSTEGGAEIFKRTASGHVKRYRAASCFAFSSVNVHVRHHADETRITVLALLAVDDADEEIKAANLDCFRKLQTRASEVLRPDFASRPLASGLIPTFGTLGFGLR